MILFFIALSISFLGSIPPGTINLKTAQYAMEGRKEAAIYFALATVLIEFIYAAIAVKFQIYFTSNLGLNFWFKTISGVVLIILGLLNLFKKRKTKHHLETVEEKRSALVKGLFVGIANPLSIPFWLMVTTYLDAMGWVVLDGMNFWIYVLGIASGTSALLLLVIYLGARSQQLQNNTLVLYKIPGVILILMAGWTFMNI